MNVVVLAGRLTKDPEVYTGTTTVAKYTLAVDKRNDDTDYISCVAFGKGAEFAQKYLHKGMKIIVEGHIQTGSYEKDGRKVYTTDVVVENHEFAEKKSDMPF